MIEIRLKCKCTDGETAIQVRERFENEDITDYMEYIQYVINVWHSDRGCPETTLEYVKLPISEDNGVAR